MDPEINRQLHALFDEHDRAIAERRLAAKQKGGPHRARLD